MDRRTDQLKAPHCTPQCDVQCGGFRVTLRWKSLWVGLSLWVGTSDLPSSSLVCLSSQVKSRARQGPVNRFGPCKGGPRGGRRGGGKSGRGCFRVRATPRPIAHAYVRAHDVTQVQRRERLGTTKTTVSTSDGIRTHEVLHHAILSRTP